MKSWIAAGCLVVGLARLASGEIYKCVGPNGEVRFTSDTSQCPHAAPHAPKDSAVQRAEKPASPLVSARPGAQAAPRRGPASAADEGAGSEVVWKQKKADAERRVRELELRVEYLSRAAAWCNRGNGFYTEDSATGLRENLSCDDVDAEYEDVKQQKAEAERYLAEGLEEECRRAGCLPGWLR